MSSTSLDKKIAEQVATWRSEKLSEFDPAALAWLSVVPAWTERLAELASFPAGPSGLEQFLERAEAKHICEREKRDRTAKSVQRSARALAALWPLLDEKQRAELTPRLRRLVELMPPGAEQKRILRRIEMYEAVEGGGSFLSRLRGSLSRQGSTPGDERRVASALLNYLEELQSQPASALDVGWLSYAANKLHDPDHTVRVLEVLLSIHDPEVALRALAPLAAADKSGVVASGLALQLADRVEAPETRAQLLLSVAPNVKGYPGELLRAAALKSVSEIEDPVSRAFVYLDAGPFVEGGLLEQVTQGLLETARRIDDPLMRAKVLAGALPFLPAERKRWACDEIVELTRGLPEAVKKADVLVPVARALAEAGAAGQLQELAALEETPVGRAKIIIETLPHLRLPAQMPVARGAVEGLGPNELEEVLGSASPAGVGALYANYSFAITNVVTRAIAENRVAAAARIAALLPESHGSHLFENILGAIDRIPTLQERVDAITQVAAYVPRRMLGAAGAIAAKADSSPRFSATDSARPESVEYVQGQRGPTFLFEQVVAAGKGIMAACQKETLDIPAATTSWAQFASRCDNVSEAANFLTERVRAAVEHGNTGEALELLNVATPLAKLVGAELEPAVIVAKHRIQIAFRQEADERHLARYLRRREQIDAFKELLAEPDGPDCHWALHYLGMGGVGKTMLVRYIMARLAVREDGSRLPAVRVDFDHINPDYPARRPGELLASLAEELRFYGGAAQESRFAEFMNHLLAVHGALSNEPPPHDPLQNIHGELFRNLLDKFAALLETLPKPIVLILDTCEELAKLEPAGAILPSVEATFTILEELQKRVAGLRVVFAGRRLLAQAGESLPDGRYGWQVKLGSVSERNRLLPQKKKYLRLHVVRGFTEQEAADYFSFIRLEVDGERKAAILEASPDPGRPADIERHDDEPSPGDAPPRYNPFDLHLYAEWLREDPGVTEEMIRSSDTDPYVEMRIVGRITEDPARQNGALSRALPAVVLLRRFDVDMLRDVVPGGDEALRRVYRDLGAQEWIDFQQDVLQVDMNLLPRLERYYRHGPQLHLRDGAHEALRPTLAARLDAALAAPDPFATLTVAEVDAALRLLPAEEAAAFWDRIERRVVDMGNWAWADNVCAYLLEEHNAAGPDDSPLRAAVRATRAAVALHSPPYEVVERWWVEVADKAKHHPDPSTRRWLEARAAIALGPVTAEHVGLLLELRDDCWRYEQLVAGFAASLERHGGTAAGLLTQLDSGPEAVPPELRAFLASVNADPTGSPKSVRQAVELTSALPERSTRQRWADWHAPACVADRARLELLRSGRSAFDDRELIEWANAAAGRLDNADSERLLSRVIQLTLERGVFRHASRLLGERLYDPRRRPECATHRTAPPLFASVAEALLVGGRGGEAERLVADVLVAAQANTDDEIIKAANLLRLRIARRMRRPSALTLAVDLIALEQPRAPRLHCWWATQVALTTEATVLLLDAVKQQTPKEFHQAEEEVDTYSALDAYEYDLLAESVGRPAPYVGLHRGHERSYVAWAKGLVRARLELREYALRGSGRPVFSDEDVRPRALAEVALEEAELLALRLPYLSRRLFEVARGLFEKCGDAFGGFRVAVGDVYAAASTAGSVTASDLRRVEQAYERCREEVKELPSWDSIEGASGLSEDQPWYDWLLRVVRLKAWEVEPQGGARTDEANSAIARHYGDQPQFEMAAGLGRKTETAKGTRVWPVVLVLLLLLAGVVVLLILGVKWALAHPKESMSGAGFVGIAVISLLFYSKLLLPRMTRRMFLSQQPRLLLQEGPPGGKIQMSLEGWVLPFWYIPFELFLFLRLYSGERRRVSREANAPAGYESYRKVTPDLALTRFKSLRGLTFSRRTPLMLVVDRALEHYAWEAPLELAGRRRPSVAALRFVRAGELLPRPSEVAWADGLIHLYCDANLGHVFERAWQKHKPPVLVDTSGKVPVPGNAEFARMMHVVGYSTRARSGPVFSVARLREETPSAPVSFSAFDSGPHVVVVQEAPAERIRRLDVDREQTAQTRAWAAELFRDRGLQAVILLPALPLALAGQVIETLAKGLRGKKSPDIFKLLEAVGRARKVVADYSPPAPGPDGLDMREDLTYTDVKWALRELSLEITVFARSPYFEYGRDKSLTGFTTT